MMYRLFKKSAMLRVRKMLFFMMLLLPAFLVGQDQMNSWKIFSLGSPALTLNLPVKPGPIEETIEPSLLQMIHSYWAYGFKDINTCIEVRLFHIAYTEEKYADLSSCANQVVRELESQGALNIKYKSSSIEIDGKQGLRQKGTLMVNGLKQNFLATYFAEGSKVWKVITFAKAGDKTGQRTVHNILNSISFK